MVVSRAVLWFACCISATTARNPLIARIGMADPHMHVFKGIGNDRFVIVMHGSKWVDAWYNSMQL